MAEFPALPLWTDAYMGDTQHLSMEESGCYLHILMVSWRRSDCAVDDDDEQLARICRISTTKWRKIRVVLEPFFTRIPGENGGCGKLTQKRLQKEYKNASKKSQQAKDAANSRWLKTKETGNADAYAGGIPPYPYPYPYKKALCDQGEEVERCSTCGGVYPEASIGRVSGCSCPPNPNWKPKPLPPGIATIRSNGERQDQQTDAAGAQADDGVVFDLAALIGGFGTPSVQAKTPGKTNGSAPEVAVMKPKVSWRMLPDGSFERI